MPHGLAKANFVTQIQGMRHGGNQNAPLPCHMSSVLGVLEGIVGNSEVRLDRRRGWPLSALLLAMCLAILLPTIALGGLALRQLMASERASVEARILAAVDNLSSDMEREMMGYWRLGEALASSPLLQAGDYEGFERRSREMQGSHGWVVIVDLAKGTQVANTSLPSGVPYPPPDDIELIRSVLQSGMPEITGLFYEGQPVKPMVGVRIPVIVEGQFRYVLTVAIPTEILLPLLDKDLGTRTASVSIADKSGRLIAVSTEGEGTIGSLVSKSAAEQIEHNVPVAKGINRNGVEVIRAIRSSSLTNWVVEAAVPEAALQSVARKEWLRFAVMAVILICSSIGLAALFARRIAAPIQFLTNIPDYTRFDVAPRTGLVEADRVGAALVTSIRELGTSKERLRLALTAAGAGVWEYDFKNKDAKWSPEMAVLYGFPETLNPPQRDVFWSYIDETDRDRIRSEALMQMEQGGPFVSEFKFIRPNGEVIWVSSRGTVELGPDGRARTARGIDQDITEEKQSQAHRETLLRETAERLDELQSLYDSATIGLALLDRRLRIRRINQVLAEMIGLPAERLLGKHILKMAPCVSQIIEPRFRHVLKTGEPITGLEFSGTTPDQPNGDRIWVAQFYPLRVDGEVAGLGVICEDITEEKKAQLVQAHLAAIVEFAPDAIVSTSPDGRVRSWNPGAERMFGYTASEAIGQPAEFLMIEGSRDDPGGISDPAIKGEDVRREVLRRRKDGTSVPVSISASPMRDAHGRIIAVSMMFRDISEQKRREDHTRFIMRELSHRSKNLLAVIQAMARQTARTSRDIQDFNVRFNARVAGLAQSHDLLVNQDWRGVPVMELVRAQLAPFVDRSEDRLVLSGPLVSLKPEAAQNIGLALHELATNASKHGALSTPSGRIEIGWEIESRDGHRRFRMNWRESGGPEVSKPSERGFGSTVVETMVSRALDGDAQLEWKPHGIEWHLSVPATCVAAEMRVGDSGDELPQTAAYELQAVRRSWAQLKNGRSLPSLDKLHLDTMPGAGNAFIVSVGGSPEEPLFEISWIGAALVKRLEKLQCAVGRRGDPAEFLRMLDGAYRRAVRETRCCYDWASAPLQGGLPLTFEYVVLPISEDGARTSHLLGMIVFADTP